MDYPIKTLSQLKPILQGFRKTAGLTQAAMASHLGVTQQTYAQLEANPAAVSVERLFKVLRVLEVGLTLTQTAGESTESGAGENAAPSPAVTSTTRITSARAAKNASAAATGDAKRKTQSARKQTTSPEKQKQTQTQTQARVKSPAKRSARTITREVPGNTTSEAERAATKPKRAGKKRENW